MPNLSTMAKYVLAVSKMLSKDGSRGEERHTSRRMKRSNLPAKFMHTVNVQVMPHIPLDKERNWFYPKSIYKRKVAPTSKNLAAHGKK